MRKIPFGRPMIDQAEKDAVLDVLEGPVLVHGERTKTFEKDFSEFTSAPYALSLSSCTAGLHLAYFYLGLSAGDEVIVPAQTHSATAHAVEFCGSTPVFVDAEITTGNIDIQKIEEKITVKTKAISVVHFLGMPVDMRKIVSIANKHNLFIVEDCALAIGSRLDGIHMGLWGDVGCFSFYPVKHMTTAEGGMLITKHEKVAKKIERTRAFGVDRTVDERKVPGVYDVTQLGYNYRMNEIEAAIGIEQLKKMPEFLKKRKINSEILRKGLENITELTQLQSSKDDLESSYYCHSIILNEKISDKRFEFVEKLKIKGVGTSVYYPQPVPLMSYYKDKYKTRKEDYPNASMISYQSVALPIGPHLNEDDMRYIVDSVKFALQDI